MDRNRRAFADYLPTPFDGDVDYLRASAPFPVPDARVEAVHAAAAAGWEQRVASISVRDVPGDHFSALSTDHAPALASAIRGIVDARLSFGSI